MDGYQIVQFVLKTIRERKGQISEVLEGDHVSSMEHYRRLMGELDALNYVAQELSGLLEKQERMNDESFGQRGQ